MALSQVLPLCSLHNLPVIYNVEVLHMHTWVTVSNAEEDLRKGNFELTESNLFKLVEQK